MKHFMKALILRIIILLPFAFVYQTVKGEQTRIANVRFEMNDTGVVIMYDVFKGKKLTNATSAEEINILVFLRKENDPSFSILLQKVSGDVGTGRWFGAQRKIFWDIRKEFPDGIEETDYFFEVRSKPVEQDNSKTYTWIGVGAGIAIIGGITTYLMVSDNTGEGKNGEFPPPPGRPK